MRASDVNIMPNLCDRNHPFHYTTALNLLAKLGVDIDAVEMVAVGEYENYKGEIRRQDPKPGTRLEHSTRIVLEVGSPSAVDNMPYQFFYGLFGRTAGGSDWDRSARRLMAPFDAAVIRHDAAARLESLRFSFGVIDEWHIRRFLQLFDFQMSDVGDGLDEAVVWSAVLPAFHLWAGNPRRVAEILGLLFGYRFRIVENAPSRFDIPDGLRYRLGSKAARLGRESVIGRSFMDWDSTYEIVISDLSREEAVDFLPGRPTRKKLERTLDLCMPGHLEFRIRLELTERCMMLGEERRGSHLGYSTHIRRRLPGDKTANAG